MKVIKNDIVSGTEDETTKKSGTSTQVAPESDQKQVKEFKAKFIKYKEEYIKNNSLESMVYENGSALALLYKEITRLNQLLTSNLQQENEQQEIKR